MEVTKELAVQVSAEIKKAVEEILAKHGLAEPKVKTTYGDIYKLVIESSVEAKDASGVNTKSAEAIYYTRFGYTAYDAAFKATELVAPTRHEVHHGRSSVRLRRHQLKEAKVLHLGDQGRRRSDDRNDRCGRATHQLFRLLTQKEESPKAPSAESLPRVLDIVGQVRSNECVNEIRPRRSL